MLAPEAYGIHITKPKVAGQHRWVMRPTIARNTSGFTRQEIMAALRVAASRPSGKLLLDLTKSQRGQYRGWCHSIAGNCIAVAWTYDGIEYLADCHIRVRLADIPIIRYTLQPGKGKKMILLVSRWQALCLLLAHEIAHWRQAVRDGRVRCLQLDADRAAIRVAKKLGVYPPSPTFRC